MKNILTILWYYITAGRTAKKQLRMLENTVYTAYDLYTKRIVVIRLQRAEIATIRVKGVTLLGDNKQTISGYIFIEDEQLKFIREIENSFITLEPSNVDIIDEDLIKLGGLNFTRI